MWRKKPVSWWLPLFSFYLLHNKHQTAYTLKIIKCCMHNVRMSNIIINIAVVRFARAKRFSPPLFYSCSFFECLWVRFLSFIFSLSLSCIFAMALSLVLCPLRHCLECWRDHAGHDDGDCAIKQLNEHCTTAHAHCTKYFFNVSRKKRRKKNQKFLIIICIVWLIRLVVW